MPTWLNTGFNPTDSPCAPLQLLKERASGMYKLSAFYFARTSSDMPLDLAIPTVFIVIVYFMSGLRTDGAKYFFENYLSVVLVRLKSAGSPDPCPLPKLSALRTECFFIFSCSISGSINSRSIYGHIHFPAPMAAGGIQVFASARTCGTVLVCIL